VPGLSECYGRLSNAENGEHVSLVGVELGDHRIQSILEGIFFVKLQTQIAAKGDLVEFFAEVGGAFCVSFVVMVFVFGKVGGVVDKADKEKDLELVNEYVVNPREV
jgi:hypothetical protein